MRYVVGEPVPGGYGWWDVTDTKENQTMATFWRDMPGAEREARKLCAQLNTESELW